jgi:hypothetical protein
LEVNVTENQTKYEKAGEAFQDADKERAIAEQSMTTSKAALDDAKAALSALSAEGEDKATELKRL